MWKSGPCFNMEIQQQVTKYCGKEEERSNFSAFPHYFQYISNFRKQITYSFVESGYSIYFFLNSANLCRGTDTSKYIGESPGLWWDNKSTVFSFLH